MTTPIMFFCNFDATNTTIVSFTISITASLSNTTFTVTGTRGNKPPFTIATIQTDSSGNGQATIVVSGPLASLFGNGLSAEWDNVAVSHGDTFQITIGGVPALGTLSVSVGVG